MRVDEMTGTELNQTEAKLSRKMRAGDATPSEITEYNMISKRMGVVNVSLDRQRMNVAAANGFTPAQKKVRRKARKKNIKKNKRR
tara:strand:- start:1427 stop:1681 length:255 start_codon:yes stop_codon:yes gene_type:complete